MLLELDYKRAMIEKVRAEIQGLGSAAGGMTPQELQAYAAQYASTGQIPSGLPKGTFGAVASVAKDLPKVAGQILDRSTGIAPSTGDASLKQSLGNLYSAIQLAENLKQLDNERWGGVISGGLGFLTGNDDQARYVGLRSQIVDLISRARSGAALTETEIKQYNAMLPGRFSESFFIGTDSQVKIDTFINTLTNDLKNKASAQGWAINGLSTVDFNGQQVAVGSLVQNALGQIGRVNADGTITVVSQ
jgi:hypothetical protein